MLAWVIMTAVFLARTASCEVEQAGIVAAVQDWTSELGPGASPVVPRANVPSKAGTISDSARDPSAER